MRQHNGMRPQDIVILVKLACLKEESWQYRDLSAALHISISEIAESLHRSDQAGLYSADTRKLNRLNFREFLQYGLKYVFPASPGAMATGLGTAHSHPYFSNRIKSELNYVWPYDKGNLRGLTIQPLHAKLPQAALKDDIFYKLMASIDVLRVGKVRELNLANKVINEMLG